MEITRRGRVPLFLVRHACTAWNQERRFLGRTDVPLDEEGRQQAARLGHRLAEMPIQTLFTSPLSRAAETAGAIARHHPGLQPRSDLALVELHQGELEGMASVDLPGRFGPFFERWFTDPADTRVPGGETLRECQSRGVAAIERFCAVAETSAPVVVVTHQMVLASFFCAVLELPLRHYRLIGQRNTTLDLLSWGEGGFRLHRLNDAAHLDG